MKTRWLAGLLVVSGIVASPLAARQPSVAEAARGAQQVSGAAAPGAAVRAGSLIYVPGSVATGQDGRVTGDIRAQTGHLLDRLKSLLARNGSRIENVAAVNVYLKRASDFAAMNAVYATYWPAEPPVRTTIVTNLVVPEALVEISMIAVADGAERRVVHPAGWPRSPNPYSYGIRSGDTLFLSGLVPRGNQDNMPIKGDITTQTKAVLGSAGEILRAGGMDYADVVSARVYLTDAGAFDAMNNAYRGYFPLPPARATVRAGLTGPDYLVEIALTAVAGRDRTAVTTPNADGTPGRANPNLSSAIKIGNRLFLSGMLGNTDTATNAAAQTREALARIGRTLKAAGFDRSNVVDSTVYLTNTAAAPDTNEAYRRLIGGVLPATTTCEAGLMSPSALVEIMMTAAR